MPAAYTALTIDISAYALESAYTLEMVTQCTVLRHCRQCSWCSGKSAFGTDMVYVFGMALGLWDKVLNHYIDGSVPMAQ
eukprot:6639666-Ditylum_brightwellii.AAC.1